MTRSPSGSSNDNSPTQLSRAARRPLHGNRPITYYAQLALLSAFVAGAIVLISRTAANLGNPAANAPVAVQAPSEPKSASAATGPTKYYIEGETLQVAAKSRPFGFTSVNVNPPDGSGTWVNGTHMLASQTQKGDWLELDLPQKTPGKYKLTLFATRCWYFGIVRLSVNGKQVGPELDLWAARFERSEFPLGQVNLLKKRNVLRFEVVGASPNNSNGLAEFAFDGIQLDPER